MVPRSPYHYQVYGKACYQVQKYPHGGHLALYRGPKAQFWMELGQMSQCHINRFEWPCNMSKWGFLTMLSTMVTFVFWLEGSVINKFKMEARVGAWVLGTRTRSTRVPNFSTRTRTRTQTTGNISTRTRTRTQHQSTQYSHEYWLSNSSKPCQWYS